MWMTSSGVQALTAAETASGSRTSPSMLRRPSPTRASSYSEGRVTPPAEKPVTRAPSDCSHSASQAPLNPVWPVSSTRRSRQKPASGAGPGGVPAARIPARAARVLTWLGPCPPRSAAGTPPLLELSAVAQRVHRLPEALVAIARELAFLRERAHGLLLPHRAIVLQVALDPR